MTAAKPRNPGGKYGPVCNNCGGYGYTLTLSLSGGVGGSAGCHSCEQTGIQLPTRKELSDLVQKMLKLGWGGPGTVPPLAMSRQMWVEMLAWATSSGTPVANTTTETIMFPNVTIPANYLQDGRTLWIKALGQYSTTATPTLQFLARYGGVTGTLIAKTVATTTGSGVTAALWELELMLTVRSNGSAGTVMGNGHAHFGSALAQAVGSATGAGSYTNMSAGGVLTPATAALDLTADTAFALGAVWGAASASNTLTGLNYYIESKN